MFRSQYQYMCRASAALWLPKIKSPATSKNNKGSSAETGSRRAHPRSNSSVSRWSGGSRGSVGPAESGSSEQSIPLDVVRQPAGGRPRQRFRNLMGGGPAEQGRPAGHPPDDVHLPAGDLQLEDLPLRPDARSSRLCPSRMTTGSSRRPKPGVCRGRSTRPVCIYPSLRASRASFGGSRVKKLFVQRFLTSCSPVEIANACLRYARRAADDQGGDDVRPRRLPVVS